MDERYRPPHQACFSSKGHMFDAIGTHDVSEIKSDVFLSFGYRYIVLLQHYKE